MPVALDPNWIFPSGRYRHNSLSVLNTQSGPMRRPVLTLSISTGPFFSLRMAPFETNALSCVLSSDGRMGTGISKAEEFRSSAAECDKLAEQAKDPEAKRMLREAASNWRKMAEQAQRFGL